MDGAVTVWPDLAYDSWRETAATLQLGTQIVGKVRLKLTPWLNHGWQVPLYVTAHRFWRALLQADRIFKLFRTGFLGKASLVHFFWGSFDLAVTRFSERKAPRHPGGVPRTTRRGHARSLFARGL